MEITVYDKNYAESALVYEGETFRRSNGIAFPAEVVEIVIDGLSVVIHRDVDGFGAAIRVEASPAEGYVIEKRKWFGGDEGQSSSLLIRVGPADAK